MKTFDQIMERVTQDPEAEAVKIINTVVGGLDFHRKTLARFYAEKADGGTTVEHEVGECITLIRKALVRVRKAQGELAQMSLPLDEG